MSPTQAVYFFPNPTESLRVVPEHGLNPTFILVFMSGGDRPTRRVPAGTCRVATLERLPSIDSSQSQINLTHPAAKWTRLQITIRLHDGRRFLSWLTKYIIDRKYSITPPLHYFSVKR